MFYRHLFFTLLLITTSGLYGQALHDEIVVTASALPETVESTPAATTVITREEIEQREARDVADVLREVPGVVVSRTGSPGRATSLFTRGSNSTHTLVLWNGIEITNPYFAGYDWGRFSTAGVEQIEIVRGPFSALYGSDAVAGVVNVLTNPKRSELRGSVEAGEHGLRNGNVVASYVSGALSASGSFESRDDDGFAPNDDFSQDAASVALRFKPSDSFSVGLSARHTNYDLGIPTNLNATYDALVPSLHRRQDGTERQIAIPIEQILGRFSYELTLAESKRDDDFNDPDDPSFYISGSTKSTTRRARLTTRTNTSAGTFVIGGEYERAAVDDVTNFGTNLDDSRRTERSLFVEDRFTHAVTSSSRIEVSAGARYDDYETFGSEVSPRIAAAFVTGTHKFRAGYGEAFRAPSVGELYFPFLGNAALEAERSRSYELGYDHASGFSATLFRGEYDDLIVFDLVTQHFANIGRASAKGIELAYQRAITASVHANASYTYTDTNEEGFDRPLLRRPKHSGSLFAGWRGGNLEINAGVSYTGARADVQAVAPFGRITNGAYATLDANVQFHAGRFAPFIRVENLTNTKYEEVEGYPSASRRISAGLKF